MPAIFISVVIPTRNNKAFLELCLNSIKRLEQPLRAYEVIVVDNGSTDGTARLVEEFATDIPCLRGVYVEIPGLLSGRHTGFSVSAGEVICYIDDDVVLDPGWLVAVHDAFSQDQGLELATGPSRPLYGSEVPGWLDFFWEVVPGGGRTCTWLSLLDLGDSDRLIDPRYVYGLNFAVRRHSLVRFGGFHPDVLPDSLIVFLGDGETGVTLKALASGVEARYIAAMKLQHHVPGKRLTRAYFRKRIYGQGISDSFTGLRAIYLNPRSAQQKKSVFSVIKAASRRVVRFFRKRKKQPVFPGDVAQMMAEFDAARAEGFNFHREAFARSSTVRAWVLKENYWDYTLPLPDEA